MKCEQRMLHPEIAPMESMDICFGLCLLWSLLALCSLFIFFYLLCWFCFLLPSLPSSSPHAKGQEGGKGSNLSALVFLAMLSIISQCLLGPSNGLGGRSCWAPQAWAVRRKWLPALLQ